MADQTRGEFYRTSDLYYAAFLKVSAVPFVDCVREGDRSVFLFENSESIRDLKRAFFSRTPTKIAILTYSDEVQALKVLTHM